MVESACHEIAEAMVDPQVNLWVDRPGVPGVQMALEIADMTQDTYEIDVDGEKWHVANFVTPAYFESRFLDPAVCARFLASGGRFDWAGRMTHPGQILPTGYAIQRRAKEGGGWSTYPVWGSSTPIAPERIVAKAHPWARSTVRGAKFA